MLQCHYIDCLYNSIELRNKHSDQINNSKNIFINEIKKIYNNMSTIKKKKKKLPMI